MQVPVECPQEIADLVEACLGMEPQTRPSARDAFDVISKAKTAQDQQSAQDPWQLDDGASPYTANPAAAKFAAPVAAKDMSSTSMIDIRSTTTTASPAQQRPSVTGSAGRPRQHQSVHGNNSNVQDVQRDEEMV